MDVTERARCTLIAKFGQRLGPAFSPTTLRNMEISVYNETLRVAAEKRVEAVWDNFIFKHLYASLGLRVLHKLESDPELARRVLDERLAPTIMAVCCEPEAEAEAEGPSGPRSTTGPRSTGKTAAAQATEAAADGIFKCRRCGSRKVDYTEKQTRSADEALTVFLTCLQCGARWKN